ncbi:metal homeostatis protein bsd2 [Moniliophthora roreri MCA 2997]|uniref:Metal homeostatis protein bsd2 n=1 Tax=Moniliophthora roreri (strain MCA 2997) TaxID=1381753 RepID=V2XHM5_MONRO|nr:metal homeostatis protein bsd2 [Moniliophthora roreri MCA 2997]
MPARYSPLQNNDELNAAFDGEDESEDESTPLNRNQNGSTTPTSTSHSQTTSDNQAQPVPGAYDFERDYDHPPPGSPPGPSALALPNDFGNSNGLLPSSPIRPQFQVVGAVLPTHYARVPTEEGGSGAGNGRRTRIGGGTENDGVFANVMAKPQPAQVVHMPDGNVHLVPEEVQKEAPPSYQSAQADAVPPYWETTVVAPTGGAGDPGSDMIIEDLPSGSVLVFIINMLLSFFFQFIGFLLTFLLHTSHAGKYGSRAGLGLTLIQYGYYSRTLNPEVERDYGGSGEYAGSGSYPGTGATPTSTGDIPMDTPYSDGVTPATQSPDLQMIASRDWLSFLLMTVGWFLLLTSFAGFWRVKRWESSIRSSAAAASTVNTAGSGEQGYTREQMEQEAEVRRNLETVFGISFDSETRGAEPAMHVMHVNEHGHAIVIPTREFLEEQRLTRDLRAAGLL